VRRAEDIAAECAAADEAFRGAPPGEPPPGPPARPDRPLDEAFPPRPGSWCGWCDYRARCPEGSAAAEPRQPWDGLAADIADNRAAGAPPITV